jgi:hypothetical protein
MKTDNQFVCRVSHILTNTKMNQSEKLSLISLSYLKMAFPEKETPPIYNALMDKLYGKEWIKWDEQPNRDINFWEGFEAAVDMITNSLDQYDSNELATMSVWDFIEKLKDDIIEEVELYKKDG